MRATIILGGGERLVLVGHEVMILAPGDGGEQNVYTAEDWRATSAPSYEIDGDGEMRRHDGARCYGPAIPFRFARCPSEAERFERLFARTFSDGMRIVRAPLGRTARRRARFVAGLRDRGVSRGWRRRYGCVVLAYHTAPLYPGDPRVPGPHAIYAARKVVVERAEVAS